MQTFLPSSSFQKSAKILDYRRLGKQRVESLQILNVLLGIDLKGKPHKAKGWTNHPAKIMWIGHEGALFAYMCAMCNEWEARGYNNLAMRAHIKRLLSTYGSNILAKTYNRPSWLGNKRFHASHRSNLLRKDFKYYSQFKWKEPNNLEYVWPVSRSVVFHSTVKTARLPKKK